MARAPSARPDYGRARPIWLECTLLSAALTLFGSARALADTLRVGTGQTYATPCAAVAAAKTGDVIEIAAATYSDSCAIAVAGLTLRGVGGQPKIDLSATDHPAQYKGIYVVTADGVTIENLELMGAHIAADKGLNAAAIRIEAKNLTVRRCKIHDNQNGILGGTSGTLTIEHSEFYKNGVGNGCNDGGCTHNLYVANIDTLYFRYNWSHAIASDTPDKGHLLKSRAKANYIEYNRLSGEDGPDSYELEFPNGGLALVVGNVIQKGRASGNSVLMSWGAEGASNPDKRVFVSNNTFVNDLGRGTFIQATGATLSAHNNLFVGAGTPASSGALPADNLTVADPQFVDRAAYDYHLSSGSPALGKGSSVASVDGLPVGASFEYVHPLGQVARASTRDVGAFEYRSGMSPIADAGAAPRDASSPRTESDAASTRDGGAPPAASPSDASASGATDASASGPTDTATSGAADGGEPPMEPSSGDGGCALSHQESSSSYGLFAALSLLLGLTRRTRRARRRSVMRDSCALHHERER